MNKKLKKSKMEMLTPVIVTMMIWLLDKVVRGAIYFFTFVFLLMFILSFGN